jgi:NADH-quinone oxidoreductase subunit G
MEITTFLEKSVDSEMSGNVIDLCPVGALTSKPYSYEARPWELNKTETIDIMDAVGSNIRMDSKGWEVKRVLPRVNEEINEEWISDKTRYACDGLLNNRIDTPYIKVNGEFKEATWKDVLSYIDKNLENKKTFGGVIGQLVDLETSYAFKKLFTNVFNSQLVDFRQKDILFDTSNEINYLFNTKINQIDECDFILLIGTNPRLEATIVNYRIRKAIKSGCKVYSIGNPGELNYKYKIIGDNLSIIDDLINDKITESKIFKDSKNPAVIIGESVLNSQISKKLINSIKNLLKSKDKLNGLNILHQSASSVGSLFLGLQCENLNDLYNSDVLYLLNADEIAFKKNKNQFVIYQGTHGGENSTLADVILPGAAYSEKDGSFANLEGRVQKSFKASYPPGLAKEDWSIFLEIAKKRNISIGYNSFEDLKKNMISEHNMLGFFDHIPEIDYSKVNVEAYEKIDFKVKINEIDYYQTNIIARSSKTMMECKLSKLNDKKNGTEN